LALAEIEVIAAGKNIARGAAVTATDSQENPNTSAKFLVDGFRDATVSYGDKLGQTVQMLRKAFTVSSPVKRATVYVTARGLYELRINGKRVDDGQLAPGWTEYNIRVPYQTYDVTSLLKDGDNAVGAFLGVGWYAGPIGALVPRGRELYGPYRQLLARLDRNNRRQNAVDRHGWLMANND
jgi:hypothetical protein